MSVPRYPAWEGEIFKRREEASDGFATSFPMGFSLGADHWFPITASTVRMPLGLWPLFCPSPLTSNSEEQFLKTALVPFPGSLLAKKMRPWDVTSCLSPKVGREQTSQEPKWPQGVGFAFPPHSSHNVTVFSAQL